MRDGPLDLGMRLYPCSTPPLPLPMAQLDVSPAGSAVGSPRSPRPADEPKQSNLTVTSFDSKDKTLSGHKKNVFSGMAHDKVANKCNHGGSLESLVEEVPYDGGSGGAEGREGFSKLAMSSAGSLPESEGLSMPLAAGRDDKHVSMSMEKYFSKKLAQTQSQVFGGSEGKTSREKRGGAEFSRFQRETYRDTILGGIERAEEKAQNRALQAAMKDAELQRGKAMMVEDGDELTPSHGQLLHCAHRITMSRVFEVGVAFMIMVNSVFIGMEVHVAAMLQGSVSPGWVLVFQLSEFIFTVGFFLEFVLRLLALGPSSLFCGPDWHWGWFDLFIVGSSCVELTMTTLMGMGLGADLHWELNLSEMRLARVVRVTRVLRILRLPRIIRYVAALKTLLFSIFVTLRALMWSLVLILLIVYVFSILFTRTFLDYKDSLEPAVREYGEVWWGDLFSSMMSLFKAITGGVSWHECSQSLLRIHPLYELLFGCYIAFTVFAVLNVVTGVFCQSAITAAERDPDLIALTLQNSREAAEKQMTELFESLDVDGSGQLTIAELEELIDDNVIQARFMALGLHVTDAWSLFKLIDTDKSDVIDLEEFVLGCMQLRGSASTLDIAKMTYDTQWIMKKMIDLMTKLDVEISKPRAKKTTLLPKRLTELRAAKAAAASANLSA